MQLVEFTDSAGIRETPTRSMMNLRDGIRCDDVPACVHEIFGTDVHAVA